jgi:hypothetical protein
MVRPKKLNAGWPNSWKTKFTLCKPLIQKECCPSKSVFSRYIKNAKQTEVTASAQKGTGFQGQDAGSTALAQSCIIKPASDSSF